KASSSAGAGGTPIRQRRAVGGAERTRNPPNLSARTGGFAFLNPPHQKAPIDLIASGARGGAIFLFNTHDSSVSLGLPLAMAYGNALAVLADPTRRKVFERLRAGPRPVNVLAQGLPVSRPAVSQHLKVLKEAGLVEERSEGVRRIYSLRREGLR